MRRRMKIAVAAGLGAFIVGAAYLAVAQQQIEESQRARTLMVKGGTYHVLPATPETTQWGWLDIGEKPKLIMNSGDTVAVETNMHSLNKIQPGTTMDEIVALRLANPGGGPHTVTGPIYVNGAEPGDVMELRIKKIVPKAFGVNFNLPGKQFPTVGAMQEDFPNGFVKYFYLDWDSKTTEFKPGITVDLQPFPGIVAVGIDPNDPSPRKGGAKEPVAPVSTLRPWKNASNLDINEFQEGTTLFVPVFQKGGLIWVGDAHCRQGTEVNLTAIECAYKEIVIQPIVRKDMKLEWPRLETPTHWILMGMDEDLNKAFKGALKETIDFLVKQQKVDPYEAYSLASIIGDCRVTQMVNIRKGIHCMIPKANFAKKS